MPDVPIEALQEAIRNLHGCESTWIESVPVRETFNDQLVWTGEVQVFDLRGHPEASRCYAWSYPTEGGNRRFVAALRLPPVDSPLMAVRASIAAGEPEA